MSRRRQILATNGKLGGTEKHSRLIIAAVLALGVSFLSGLTGIPYLAAADLSTLTIDDRRNIETACVLTRASGAVAYNNCVNHHLSELLNTPPAALAGSGDASSSASASRLSTTVPAAPSENVPHAVVPHVPPYQYPAPFCAENGSCYGDISSITGLPKTVHVNGYFRRDGTYVRGYYRSHR